MRFSKFCAGAATAALIVSASEASALSCLRPDVARTFSEVAASEDIFVVLLGEFAFDTPPSTETGDINAPRGVSFPARFVGQALGAEGFGGAVALDMTVALTCAGPWCGQMAPQGTPTVAFAEQTDAGYVLNVGPCGGRAFPEPEPEDIARIEACMRGEGCDEGALR